MSESESATPICPKCSTELKEDFGITDCPGCGVVCFVGMDDSVQIQGEEPAIEAINEEESDPANNESLESAYGDGVEPEDSQNTYEEFEAEDLTVQETEAIEEEYSYTEEEEFSTSDDLGSIAVEADALNEEPQLEETYGSDEEWTDDEEVALGNGEATEEDSEDSKPLVAMSAASFLDELETFAADSDVKDFESELYFDVKISGVETDEMKSELIETVADSRLDLSEEGLLENFLEEEGALYLSQIPFVRLVVIYKRILPFGLKVEWLQKEVHELETEEGQVEDEYELEEA